MHTLRAIPERYKTINLCANLASTMRDGRAEDLVLRLDLPLRPRHTPREEVVSAVDFIAFVLALLVVLTLLAVLIEQIKR
jgi:hypothetical protein